MWKFWKEESKYFISITKLMKIENESILEEEHKHINKLIEQNNTLKNWVLTFFTSAIISGIAYGITQTFSFLTLLSSDANQQREDLDKVVHSFVDMLLAIGSWSFIFLMILFIIIVVSHLFASSELKKYKEAVIQLRSKSSNQKRKNLQWKNKQ